MNVVSLGRSIHQQSNEYWLERVRVTVFANDPIPVTIDVRLGRSNS